MHGLANEMLVKCWFSVYRNVIMSGKERTFLLPGEYCVFCSIVFITLKLADISSKRTLGPAMSASGRLDCIQSRGPNKKQRTSPQSYKTQISLTMDSLNRALNNPARELPFKAWVNLYVHIIVAS